jgi:N-acetylmuramoyl-L-alanine amidase
VAKLSKPRFSVNTNEHLLLGPSGEPVSPVPASHVGTLKQRSLLVVHYTVGSKRGVEQFMRDEQINSSASAHVIVGRDGSVSQLAPFDVSTFHAGASRWNSGSVNASSIGIELENWGRLTWKDGHWIRLGGVALPDTDVVVTKPGIEGWERFTDSQLRAFFDVACALRHAYPTLDAMVAHSDLDRRRLDPGPAFPMQDLRRLLFAGASRRANAPSEE